ncbi:MAG: BlaI/MecI/CopY family transcriptional regulator [Suipraeoptans sp.]
MNEKYKSIPEGEWQVLEILWKHDEPIPSSVIVEEYQKIKDLKSTTIRTYLKRLIEKDIVDFKLIGKTVKCLYFSVFSEDEMRTNESEHFVSSYLEGNPHNLLLTLAKRGDLDKNDLAELLSALEKG